MHELQQRIATAREANDPEKLASEMQAYLNTNPSEPLARLATEELNQARRTIDDRDYQTAVAEERGDQTDLAHLDTVLQGYLEKHADGAHRLDVLDRLDQIPRRRDDRAFARARENVEFAGTDLGSQGAAWQTYLEQYPEGLHAIQVRAEIARIPDQLDERRLAGLLHETDALVAENRVTDALLHIEARRKSILAPQRQARIEERIASLESGLETADAAECLDLPTSTTEERSLAAARSRLYLLCYPLGAHRADIERRMAALVEQERSELLAALHAKLAEYGDDPLAALAALNEFRRQPAAAGADVERELAFYHFALLNRKIEASLRDMQVITLQDGTAMIGVVLDVSPGWVQVKPRTISETEKSASRLVRTSEVTAVAPPLRLAMDESRPRIQSMLSASHVDISQICSELRKLRLQASDDLYRPERLAIQVFLAGLDPTDREARQELETAGYIPHAGVYRPTATDAKTPGDTESPYQDMLDYFCVYCRENAPTETVRNRLAESFDYSFLGTMLTIPIEWELQEPKCKPTLTSAPRDPLQAELTLTYEARARRTSDSTLPASILTSLDRELTRLNQSTQISVTYEVRTRIEKLSGVGIEPRLQDGALIVNRVFPESSAARAGVEPGDRIALVEDEPLSPDAGADALALAIANGPARGVKFAFVRNSRRFHLLLERGDYTIDRYQMRSTIDIQGPLSRVNEKSVSEWNDVPGPS